MYTQGQIIIIGTQNSQIFFMTVKYIYLYAFICLVVSNSNVIKYLVLQLSKQRLASDMVAFVIPFFFWARVSYQWPLTTSSQMCRKYHDQAWWIKYGALRWRWSHMVTASIGKTLPEGAGGLRISLQLPRGTCWITDWMCIMSCSDWEIAK